MRILKVILLLLFLGAVIIFVFQNMGTVKLSFLYWHLQLPLSVTSILIYTLGALSGGLVFSMLKKITFSEKADK
jgi:uncharacterized integral membrane protein